jgi:hypothetical protein
VNDSANSRGTLRNSLREVFIVVISILIAFSLDAGWDSWRDNERESELLVALEHDFEQNRALLQAAVASNEESLKAVRRFSDLIAGSEVVPEDFDILYAMSFVVRFFSPVSATYDSLINSGDFALIRRDELRSALVEWGTMVDSNIRAEQYLTEQFMDEIYSFATGTGSLSRLLADQRDLIAGGNLADRPVTPAFDHDREQLMQNREFHNLLATRALFLQYLVRSNHELLAITERILAD